MEVLLDQLRPTRASQAQPQWTAGGFREAIAVLAKQARKEPERLLTSAEGLSDLALEEAEREAELEDLDVSDPRAERDRIWAERILPDEKAIEKVVRYEAHLGRELNRTLDQLKALQGARKAQAGRDERQ